MKNLGTTIPFISALPSKGDSTKVAQSQRRLNFKPNQNLRERLIGRSFLKLDDALDPSTFDDLSDYSLFQPEITKQYGQEEWKEDIKKAMKRAGMENKKTVFLFNDTQIKKESFLEDVDSLLNSGEVANIFETDEKVEITETVRAAAQEANHQGRTPNSLPLACTRSSSRGAVTTCTSSWV